ncbi:MAG: radical SAM protein [Nitrospiraceae bacterium]|nr:MAG: radical SAM protein [Nitrospiraceae bacterium]
MKHKKALFIVPPTGLFYRDDRCQVSLKGVSNAPRPPLDLAYMSAVLEEKGIECRMRDYPVEGGSWQDVEEEIRGFAPSLLVIYTTITSVKDDLRACGIAKAVKGEIVTIAKGGDTTISPEERLELCEDLDIAIIGEPEVTMLEIAEGRERKEILGICFREEGRVVRTGRRPFVEDIDRFPFPSRHLLKQELYVRPDTGEVQTTVQSSRGCPAKCIYCLSRVVAGAELRLRSPGNVVDELEHCVREYGIRNFFFRADTFTWDREWVVAVCREILRRKLDIQWVANSRANTICAERLMWMKRAGCWLVSFGVESGNQYILDMTQKGITLQESREALRLAKKHGLKTFVTFLIGMPWDTRETIMETFDFAREIDGDYFEVILPYPFPGTRYYEIAKRDGLIEEGAYDKFYDHFNSVVRTYHLTAAELTELKKKSFWYLYARPRYIKKIISQCDSPRALKNYLSFGISKMKAHFGGEPGRR